MKSDAMWRELEDEVRRGFAGPWLSRRASAHPDQRLLVAIETASAARVLMVDVDELPARNTWPDCAGIEVQAAQRSNSQKALIVKLVNQQFTDVFSVLADDVISKTERAAESVENVEVVFGRLREWQRFLALKNEGLSLERQRGLWGELMMLAESIIPICGPVLAINSWTGPSRAHQDFQFPRGALEVKATTSKSPPRVTITSERQLDSSAGTLFLHAFVLDEREVPSPPHGLRGSTLPELVATVRSLVSGSMEAATLYESKLLMAGWVEAWSSRYERRRWAVRESLTFEVTSEFPRIEESMLMRGVSEVSYCVSLLGCESLERRTADAIRRLA